MKIKLLALSTMFFFFFSAFFPNVHFTYFAPFIIIIIYEKSKVYALMASCFCGLFLDLLSSDIHFGILTLNYFITTWILYNWKSIFFEDSIFTIPMLSGFFSMITTSVQFFLLHIFGKGFPLSFQWVFIDLIVLSFLDVLYAFICISLPLYLLRKRILRF